MLFFCIKLEFLILLHCNYNTSLLYFFLKLLDLVDPVSQPLICKRLDSFSRGYRKCIHCTLSAVLVIRFVWWWGSVLVEVIRLHSLTLNILPKNRQWKKKRLLFFLAIYVYKYQFGRQYSYVVPKVCYSSIVLPNSHIPTAILYLKGQCAQCSLKEKTAIQFCEWWWPMADCFQWWPSSSHMHYTTDI